MISPLGVSEVRKAVLIALFLSLAVLALASCGPRHTNKGTAEALARTSEAEFDKVDVYFDLESQILSRCRSVTFLVHRDSISLINMIERYRRMDMRSQKFNEDLAVLRSRWRVAVESHPTKRIDARTYCDWFKDLVDEERRKPGALW